MRFYGIADSFSRLIEYLHEPTLADDRPSTYFFIVQSIYTKQGKIPRPDALQATIIDRWTTRSRRDWTDIKKKGTKKKKESKTDTDTTRKMGTLVQTEQHVQPATFPGVRARYKNQSQRMTASLSEKTESAT